MATDVTAFLMWAAEPKLEDRKRMGIKVIPVADSKIDRKSTLISAC